MHYDEYYKLIEKSEAFKKINKTAANIARSPRFNILLTGEKGSDFFYYAKYIQNISPISHGSLISLDSFLYDETELTSIIRLFADSLPKSIIYINEAGTTSLGLQEEILNISKNNESSLSLILSSSDDLNKMVNKNSFNKELFERINATPIEIPSINNRKSDLSNIIKFLINKYNANNKTSVKGINKASLKSLEGYNFCQGFKELELLITAAAIKTSDQSEISLGVKDLSAITQKNEAEKLDYSLDYKTFRDDLLKKYTKNYVENLLKKNKGSVQKAADDSKIHRTALSRIINGLNINYKDFRN